MFMRKSFTILCLLLVILGVEWGVKAKMPINRRQTYKKKKKPLGMKADILPLKLMPTGY